MAKGTKEHKHKSKAPPPPASSSSESSKSSSAGDSSPEPESDGDLAAQKDKLKEKVKAGPPSKYRPPTGMRAVTGTTGKSSCDWDTANRDSDLSLWAIRVPDGVKPKHLNGLVIQLPGTPSSALDPVASFSAKKVQYDMFLADPEPVAGGKRKRDDEDAEKPAGGVKGGEEMQALVALLPKKSAGDKLFEAPRPITRHLLITRSLPPTVLSHLPSSTSSLITSQPSPVPGAILTADELLDPAAIRLKKIHRVQPAGLAFRIALGGQGPVGGRGDFHNEPPAPREVPMDVDVARVEDEVVVPEVRVEESPKKKEKKVKSEGESPGKKKHKKVVD